MSSNRPNLTLDEQSFQGLLSAAFTIQEYNDKRRQALHHLDPESLPFAETSGAQPSSTGTSSDDIASQICPACHAPMNSADAPCETCHPREFRPGERLQKNWASMWLMSQENAGLWTNRSIDSERSFAEAEPRFAHQPAEPASDEDEFPTTPPSRHLPPPAPAETQQPAETATPSNDFAALPDSVLSRLRMSGFSDPPMHPSDWPVQDSTPRIQNALFEKPAFEERPSDDSPSYDRPRRPSSIPLPVFTLPALDDGCFLDAPTDASASANIGVSDAGPVSALQRLRDLRVKFRYRRADLYLGLAVFVAAVAILWPAAASPHPVAPKLSFFDQALISLGIAEAPTPATHFAGDPAIQVWIDPHTAIYYCPGEEQYGKDTSGRFSSQREAQLEHFDPAGRSACE